MKIGVVCPGKSMSIWPLFNCDMYVAVNRAVLDCGVGWWCFTDWQTYIENQHFEAAKLVKLFTTSTSRKCLIKRGYDLGGDRVLTYEEIKSPKFTDAGGWGNFSMTAGMALAYHLGAKEIFVFGADMVGEKDWDGYSNERFVRTEKVFKSTMEHYVELRTWLGEKGVEVNRLVME